MQFTTKANNDLPKVVDPIYVGEMGTGHTRKIHCEYCGEDIDVDTQHVVYKFEILVKVKHGCAGKLVFTFCKHSHKQRYLKEHPEMLDYIDFGISKDELDNYPELKKKFIKDKKGGGIKNV